MLHGHCEGQAKKAFNWAWGLGVCAFLQGLRFTISSCLVPYLGIRCGRGEIKVMRSKIRNGAIATLSAGLAAMALMGMPGTAAAGGIQPPGPTTTAENYVAWLEGKALAGDTEAANIATQFKALSFEDQFRFLTLISDQKTTEAYVDAITGAAADAADGQELDTPPTSSVSSTVLGTGHTVEVVTENGEAAPQVQGVAKAGGNAAPALASSYHDMWASYSVYDKIFGIRVTKVNVRTNYQVNGTDTTKVYPGSASHYNYVPAASFSNSPVKEWISSPPADNAQSETVWTATWTGGLGSWSARERVWGDYRGFVGGYLD